MRIRSTVALFSLVVGVAAFAPTLQAQSATNPASQELAAGPRRDATIAGVRATTTDATVSATVQTQRTSRPGRAAALTIIGAAAFVGGLLIGDDAGTAIAVGGLAVGLFGLWHWMR